jgi:hypothetical protein
VDEKAQNLKYPKRCKKGILRRQEKEKEMTVVMKGKVVETYTTIRNGIERIKFNDANNWSDITHC